jgi:PHD/YefM family antitoxin component YafN of YafNO toxin-antitoxin module
MIIKSSTALINDYDKISALCKEKMQPVYLTKDGEGDLVVMSIEAYSYREELLDIRQKLLATEAKRLAGGKSYTPEESKERIRALLNEIE